MAKTDPSKLPGWKKPKLLMNSITKVWAAAYATVGGVWKTKGISWAQPSPSVDILPPIFKKTASTEQCVPPQPKATPKTPANPYP